MPGRALGTIALVWAAACPAAAQEIGGSMKLDYQSTSAGAEADANESVAQQYYLRLTDRLFVKNLLVFTGNFYYRTGNAVQPVDFRPRYDLQLSSAGYGARVGYEPYTLRRGGAAPDEQSRRWRANVQLSPAKWPRLAYDMSRFRTETADRPGGRDNWDSYMMNWQGGSRVLATTYSRQRRHARDTLSETVESYRAIASIDLPLPGQGRLGLGYNFDRTWNRRVGQVTTAVNQHVPTANLSSQPARWVSLTGQYSGRYIRRDAGGNPTDNTDDQLATGVLTLMPTARWSIGVLRYFERTEERQGTESRNTDYWQVRANTDRIFFRRINSQFTVYRIAYQGAGKGVRFSDAYFAALRGRPHRHAELSTEVSLADRHGLQAVRYAVSGTSYLRLYPTHGSQAQVSYNAIAEGKRLSEFDISEESVSGSMQYSPDARLSFTGTSTLRRNRLLESSWTMIWSVATTYRLASVANASAYYASRETARTAGATAPAEAASSWILTFDYWLSPSTTISVNYTWRGSGRDTHDIWGAGFSAQF
ncbi:MAG TPA: hypothetical protein VNN55_09255 [bacterium]|nr:hypothetical protein [bacterium]